MQRELRKRNNVSDNKTILIKTIPKEDTKLAASRPVGHDNYRDPKDSRVLEFQLDRLSNDTINEVTLQNHVVKLESQKDRQVIKLAESVKRLEVEACKHYRMIDQLEDVVKRQIDRIVKLEKQIGDIATYISDRDGLTNGTIK